MVKTETSDCVACILNPILKAGSICGPSPLIINCPHSKTPTVTSVFERSDILLAISTVSAVAIIPGIFIIIQDISTTENFNKMILLITEVMFSLLAVIINIGSVLNNDEKLNELNGLSFIVNNRKHYGFATLIDQKTTKRFRLLSYIIILTSLLAITNFALYSLLQESNSSVFLTILKIFVLALVTLIQTILFNQCVVSIFLYILLFRKCFNQIKSVLNQHLNNDFIAIQKEILLEQTLKRLKMFYISLIGNFRQFNSFIQPSITISMLVGVAMLVFDCYIVVLTYGKVIEADPIIETRSYATIVSMIVFSYIIEYINSVVSNLILPFIIAYASQCHKNEIFKICYINLFLSPTWRLVPRRPNCGLEWCPVSE